MNLTRQKPKCTGKLKNVINNNRKKERKKRESINQTHGDWLRQRNIGWLSNQWSKWIVQSICNIMCECNWVQLWFNCAIAFPIQNTHHALTKQNKTNAYKLLSYTIRYRIPFVAFSFHSSMIFFFFSNQSMRMQVDWEIGYVCWLFMAFKGFAHFFRIQLI